MHNLTWPEAVAIVAACGIGLGVCWMVVRGLVSICGMILCPTISIGYDEDDD